MKNAALAMAAIACLSTASFATGASEPVPAKSDDPRSQFARVPIKGFIPAPVQSCAARQWRGRRGR